MQENHHNIRPYKPLYLSIIHQNYLYITGRRYKLDKAIISQYTAS